MGSASGLKIKTKIKKKIKTKIRKIRRICERKLIIQLSEVLFYRKRPLEKQKKTKENKKKHNTLFMTPNTFFYSKTVIKK